MHLSLFNITNETSIFALLEINDHLHIKMLFKQQEELRANFHDFLSVYYFIHSKYFDVSDWLQCPGQFSITNWRLPYLEDVINLPSIRWYILSETRLLGSILTWKRGCLGNRELKKYGVHGYPMTKQLNFCLKPNGRNAWIAR